MKRKMKEYDELKKRARPKMTWLVAKCKKNEIEIFKNNFKNLLKVSINFL